MSESVEELIKKVKEDPIATSILRAIEANQDSFDFIVNDNQSIAEKIVELMSSSARNAFELGVDITIDLTISELSIPLKPNFNGEDKDGKGDK